MSRLRERHMLTDKQIEKAKPAPPRGRYLLWDAVAPSLALRVTNRGHKSFIVQRRVNGRMVKVTLGTYPALPLMEAHEKACDALKEIARGKDPRQSNAARVSSTGRRRDIHKALLAIFLSKNVVRTLNDCSQLIGPRPMNQWDVIETTEERGYALAIDVLHVRISSSRSVSIGIDRS